MQHSSLLGPLTSNEKRRCGEYQPWPPARIQQNDIQSNDIQQNDNQSNDIQQNDNQSNDIQQNDNQSNDNTSLWQFYTANKWPKLKKSFTK